MQLIQNYTLYGMCLLNCWMISLPVRVGGGGGGGGGGGVAKKSSLLNKQDYTMYLFVLPLLE